MSTLDIVEAIYKGDTVASREGFSKELKARIAEKIEIKKKEIARDMFKESNHISKVDILARNLLKNKKNLDSSAYKRIHKMVLKNDEAEAERGLKLLNMLTKEAFDSADIDKFITQYEK